MERKLVPTGIKAEFIEDFADDFEDESEEKESNVCVYEL